MSENGKKRESHTEVVVQMMRDAPKGEPREAAQWFDVHRADSTGAAEKWIRESGMGGSTYRVVKAWPAVKIEVEKIEERTLTPA